MHPGEPTSPVVGHRHPGYMDYQGMGLRSQFPVERKWALGLQVGLLFQSVSSRTSNDVFFRFFHFYWTMDLFNA